ncbi:MAG: hypothetical protein PF508_00745 [Spirochaeta sp.]|nr:hypothetical protein [Spirochaeta sp.]
MPSFPEQLIKVGHLPAFFDDVIGRREALRLDRLTDWEWWH